MKTTNRTPYAGQIVRITVQTRHWPSLGIHRDRPETWTYGIRGAAGTFATGTETECRAYAADRLLIIEA